MGKKVALDIKNHVSYHMQQIFSSSHTIEEILNYRGGKEALMIANMNQEFHETLKKIITVRHKSLKFGL